MHRSSLTKIKFKNDDKNGEKTKKLKKLVGEDLEGIECGVNIYFATKQRDGDQVSRYYVYGHRYDSPMAAMQAAQAIAERRDQRIRIKRKRTFELARLASMADIARL